MADIRLTRPAAGASQNIVSEPGARFVFDFPTDEATLSRSGDNLVFTFDDGGTVQLENFYTAYSSESMPSFSVEGAEISGEDFFMAMNEPDLMPAAGPARGANQSNGNRFHDYVNAALLDGLDRLGGLDIGWGDGEVTPDIDGAGDTGGLVDFGVTVRPEVPEGLDPSIPVIDDPTYPDRPGWEDGVLGRDVLTVRESELDGKGSQSMDHGVLLIEARDGVASIVIDGVTVFENTGVPVTYGDAQVRTDEGYLTNFTFNPATGRLEYDYVLTISTQEHGRPGRDSIAHNFHVTVTDTDGDTGNGLISVVIEDDVPVAENDAAGLEENEAVSGNVVFGNNVSGTEEGFVTIGRDDYGADGAASSGSVAWNLEAWGDRASYDASAGTWSVETDYGTILLYDNGDFTFTAKKNAGLDEGKSENVSFNYTITDADDDTSSATLTVTVTGDTQPVVSFGPGATSGSVTVDEALIPGGNSQHSDNAAHSPEGDGSFTVNLKGEGGTLTLASGNDTVQLRLEADGTSAFLSENRVLTVQGVAVTVTGATFDEDSGLWSVNYEYVLNTGQTHGEHGDYGAADVLSGSISIKVTDDTDDVATGQIDVTVHDDAPVLTVGNLGNAVSVSFGADNGEGAGSLLAVKAFDADGNAITWSGGADLNKLAADKSWTSADDNIIVTRGEGNNFTFSIVDNGKDADITVTATDADGDSTSKDLALTAPSIIFGTGGGAITVDEALLPDGNSQHSDSTAHSPEGKGSFTVNLHGEAGNIVLEDGAGKSIILLENGVAQTSPQSLTVQGVTVTVTGATFDASTGKWTISYEYGLTGEQAHTERGDGRRRGAGHRSD